MLPWEFSEEYVMCLNHLILNYVPLNLLTLHHHFLVWAIWPQGGCICAHTSIPLLFLIKFIYLFTLIHFEQLQF